MFFLIHYDQYFAVYKMKTNTSEGLLEAIRTRGKFYQLNFWTIQILVLFCRVGKGK